MDVVLSPLTYVVIHESYMNTAPIAEHKTGTGSGLLHQKDQVHIVHGFNCDAAMLWVYDECC